MVKNICLILILLGFIANLKAQEKSITTLKPFKDGEIVIKKKGSISSIEMKPSFVEFSENGKYNLFFIVQFIRADKTPTKIPLITMAFYSNSRDCKFPDDLNAKAEIFIDNKVSALSNNLEDKKEFLKNGGGFASYNEALDDLCNGMYTLFLTQKTFINFLNAKKVQIKIGDYKFDLKPNNLKALNNMAKFLVSKK